MKRCSKCHKVKPLSDFSRQRYGVQGRKSECKACQVIANKEYRHKGKRLGKAVLGKCWKCHSLLSRERAAQERKRMLAEEKKFGCGAGLPPCKACQYS